MNRTRWQGRCTRVAIAGVALYLAALLAPGASWAQESTWVLVRPAPRATEADAEKARAELGIKPSDRVLSTPSGVEIWRMPKSREAQLARLTSAGSVFVKHEVLPADPREIVSPVGESDLPAAARANLERLKARGYAKRIGVVKRPSAEVTSLMLRYADTVNWTLFEKVRLEGTRHAKSSRVRNAGRFAWVGGLDAKTRECDAALFANGFASVTFGNNHLYGRFERGRDLYQIVPLGEGYHAAIEVDPDKLPDQPDLANIEDEGGDMLDLANIEDEGGDMLDLANIEDEGGDMLDRKGRPAKVPATYSTCKVDVPRCNAGSRAARAVIRVGVAFTREAQDDLPLINPRNNAGVAWPALMSAQHFADYLVDLTNAAFARSGVRSRVELAGVHQFDRLETSYADSKVLLTALRAQTPDAAVLPVHQWRDNKGADVVVLLTRDATYPGVGAISGLSPPPGTLGNAAHAYAIVVTRSADAQLSFQHELGHVLGAGHNWQANTPASFTYAHGFRKQCDWRTIMSYEDRTNCNGKGTPRIALFSSCNVLVNGNTIAGSRLENNTRVVNEQAEAISTFRP